MKFRQEFLLEPVFALRFEQSSARQPARCQRNHDEHDDRGDEHFRRHDHVGDAAQKHHDGCEGDEHDEVIHRHLYERINRITIGEVAPHENHCRAGRGGEDDEPGGIILGRLRLDPRTENMLHEQPRQEGHAERLDQPVDEQRHCQPLGFARDAAERGEVHLEHHRINHQPDEHGDGDVHL